MPAPATTNLISYEIYGFQQGWFLVSDGAGTPAVVAVPVDKPNKIGFDFDNETIKFEGGDTTDNVYITSGMTLTFDADALSVSTINGVFADSSLVTSGVTGYSRRSYGGTTAQNNGVTAGFRGRARANKRIDGAQVGTVTVDVEVFVGTLSRANAPGLTTKGKADSPQFKLSATQTTKDVVGAALPGAPAGGAFYAVSEV